MDQADDLKAFERRMIEIISSLQPSIWRWRFILLILVLFALITFYALITDVSLTLSSLSTLSMTTSSIRSNIKNDKSYISIFLLNLFRKEIYFSFSFGLLIFAFLFGIHRKMFASSIIIARFHYILNDYNMSCDSDGRLIIKPRPTTYISGGL
ncbi:unnamed protein product [Rotaria sordida]|uniref:Transmembrane protein 188 n=1 Tax=Rotaria sordida TaxID=392033 RepID=A0A814PDH3_9BILA|nr:unnamed protein product [Rotaria sordida]CAF0930994.1 unnamed protein product [Rotaria sordida]CAF1104200.1 unnamed protein product [Rotaria sordida]CAF1104773.1 unnamed protein product [Rotaria sordida]CAF3630304.1 unnamed protein product [Rotaria sordida]